MAKSLNVNAAQDRRLRCLYGAQVLDDIADNTDLTSFTVEQLRAIATGLRAKANG